MKTRIQKLLDDKISDEEKKQLIESLHNKKNKKTFKAYIKSYFLLNVLLQNPDLDEAYNKVWNQIESNKRPKKVFQIKWIKYAAAVLIIGGFSVFYLTNNTPSDKDNNQIILELSDGSRKIIKTSDTKNIVSQNGTVLGNQQQNKITYKTTDTTSTNDKLVYNTLYVPNTKRFYLELSDGTTIHVNSGSTIKYPVKFIKDKPRKIFLEGEAYFKVTKNTSHEFVVETNSLKTSVYGTSFNIQSYKNDNLQEVVLVEGSIGVEKAGKTNATEETILKPNERIILNKQGNFEKSTTNVSNHIAWIDGVLLFVNEPLGNIIKKLERHYDVTIESNYTSINNNKYTGTFDIETISDVLKTFSNHTPFTYKIKDKHIIINP